VNNLYDSLGVPKDASADAIRAAYRKKAQAHHPDKGGDVAKFQAIQTAYDVLSDEKRRSRYDATGETDQGQSVEGQARMYVASLLNAVMQGQADVRFVDVVATMRNQIAIDRNRVEAEKARLGAAVARRQEALKRITQGMLSDMLDAEIKRLEGMVAQCDAQRGVLDAAEKLLEGQSYRSEAKPVSWADRASINPGMYVSF
jgi:curved DNA-binding protein CbpA